MPVIFFFLSLLFLIVLLRVSPSTSSLLRALRSSSGVPVRQQDRGKAPQHVQSFLSSHLSLFSAFIGTFPLASSSLPASLLLPLLQLKQITVTK